jgi:hypothetical protein
MSIVGIVGAEAAKFTKTTEVEAKALIWQLLRRPGVIGVSSGHCHLGGIDIWAEEIGAQLGLTPYIFPPACQSWNAGYKPRNLQIVDASTEVHCITVRELPQDFEGMRFSWCYHCKTDQHVKSGGCWTALQAKKQGKPAFWHVVGGNDVPINGRLQFS